jgi:hypothetical protein
MRICDIDGRFLWWSFERICRWPPERLARIKVFNGHMPFGLHQFIPQPSTYITVLRDPIKRAVSEYYYHRSRRTHPIADRAARRLTLTDYIKSVRYNNPQTKALAGNFPPYQYHWYTMRPTYHFYEGPCTEDTLAMAKSNLAGYFSLIGLTERFTETLALGKVLFGWKIARFTSIQQGPKRPQQSTCSAQERALITEYNPFDIELYQFGARLFDQAIAKHATSVAAEVATIRTAAQPGAARAAYHRAGSVVRRHFIRARCPAARASSCTAQPAPPRFAA